MNSKKKLILKSASDFNFHLLGIISQEKELRFISILNLILKTELTRTSMFNLHSLEYTLFSYCDEDTGIKYSVIKNNVEGINLFGELKQIDYLMKISKEASKSFIAEKTALLKKSDIINAVIYINPETIKSLDILFAI